MLLPLVGALWCACVVAFTLSRNGYDRHRRFVRNAREIRNGFLAVFGVLFFLHIWCTAGAHARWLAEFAAVLTLVATATFGAVAMERRIPSLTVSRPRRVLALGAHPDDLELACGGTLAKMIDAGHEVHAVVMSRGKRGGNENLRIREAERGAAFLGLTSLNILDFPDTALEFVSGDMTQAIEAAIKKFMPDVIFTHSVNDQHQDHYAVHQATRRAARFHHSILCYESPSTTRNFNPSVFVDIDNYVDVKIQAVLTHRDQSNKPYMTTDRIRGMAAFRGSQAKKIHSEAFEPVRLLGSAVGDL